MEPKKPKRGFARLEDTHRKEIASMGGKAAHAKGKAHEYTKEEAQAFGREGGLKTSRDRRHMAAIGRRGGFNKRILRTLKPTL